MDNPAAPDPLYAQALAELTRFGLCVARAVSEIADAERRTVVAVAGAVPTSLENAIALGRDVDAADAALATATPRIATLSQCFDRVARAVRRTVALARRIEQGWPRRQPLADGPLADGPLTDARSVDDHRAMLLRQAARGARNAVRTRIEGDAEARERFFADLSARLDDPAFAEDILERPVEEVVRRLCRAIGLPPAAEPAAAMAAADPPGRPHDPG